MKDTVVSYIVRRYLRFDKSIPFISISAILAFLGVMVGVMVLIIAMALMNGVDKEFERKLSVMNYPLTIVPDLYSLDINILYKLRESFPDLKFSPYISSHAILQKGRVLNGGIVFGVDFMSEAEINPVFKKAVNGVSFDKKSLIIGKKNYETMFSNSKDGMLIFTSLEPTGLSFMPTIKKFEIAGYFESGLSAYDKAYMYADINMIRKLKHLEDNEIEGIHVYSYKPFEDIKKLELFLKDSGVSIIGWWEQNENFFSALAMEKKALFIVLMLIIVVASLNIISSLLMTVMNRRKEIALLLSLGASKLEIKKIFFYLGFIIGGFGTLFGVIFGFLGIFLLSNFNIVAIPEGVYGFSKLPFELSSLDLTLIILGSITIVSLSSYYPAKLASDIDVLDVLRNE